MNVSSFLRVVEAARRYGSCQLAIYDITESIPWETVLAQHFSMPVPIEELVALNKTQAQAILTCLLTKDMAYEAEIMPIAKANEFANMFCSLFSNQSSFLSNSSWSTDEISDTEVDFKPKLSGWFPLTEATFDSGIIIRDVYKIGIAWFEDED